MGFGNPDSSGAVIKARDHRCRKPVLSKDTRPEREHTPHRYRCLARIWQVEVLPQTRLRMRVQLRLADQRSAGDVERLINRRTLRLWAEGPEGLRLQSDYGYRRRPPRWTHRGFVLDRSSYEAGADAAVLADLAASEPERRHSAAQDRSTTLEHPAEIIHHFRNSNGQPVEEFLSTVSLALSAKTTAREMAEIMQQGLLPALYERFPSARIVYQRVDTEPSQRLEDIVLLRLYERKGRDEVNAALADHGFFPQAQGGFAPVQLVANSFLIVAGFLYPWLYFVPVVRPGGIFLVFLNAPGPLDLNLESPSLLETLGYGLGSIHGGATARTDLSALSPRQPDPAEVEAFVLAVADQINELLVALYDIDGFESLGRQLSTCFTTARIFEELATGFLTTNSYLRKITFFNVWDKVTSVQKEAGPGRHHRDVKRILVQPETFGSKVLSAIPTGTPLRTLLQSTIFPEVMTGVKRGLLEGTAPWVSREGASGDERLANLLVRYRNSVHGYDLEHLDYYLSHAGLLPDALIYLGFFWWLAIVYKPQDFLNGRWVE